jgi:hypothetical protein
MISKTGCSGLAICSSRAGFVIVMTNLRPLVHRQRPEVLEEHPAAVAGRRDVVDDDAGVVFGGKAPPRL